MKFKKVYLMYESVADVKYHSVVKNGNAEMHESMHKIEEKMYNLSSKHNKEENFCIKVRKKTVKKNLFIIR
jgi:predicted glycosyl hydrolase (DUF1957 family)